jgi:hypothetical protein
VYRPSSIPAQLPIGTPSTSEREGPKITGQSHIGFPASVTGREDDWRLKVQISRGTTLNYWRLLDGKSGQIKAKMPSGMAVEPGEAISVEVKKLLGVSAQPGDRIELIGGGWNTLMAIKIPDGKTNTVSKP